MSRYVVVGPDGSVLHTDTATWEEDGQFTVALRPGDLPPGQYTILAAICLNANTIDPGIRVIQYDVE